MDEDREIAREDAGRPTWNVPVGSWDSLCDRISKIGRRAVKLGFAPPLVRILRTETAPGGRQHYVVYVEGESPRLNGWEVFATILHLPEGPLVSVVPNARGDAAAAKRWHSAKPDCGHCLLSRKRNETVVLRNDSDGQVQVGSTCLADFTGHASPEQIVSMAHLLGALADACRSAEGEPADGSRWDDAYDLGTFLGHVRGTVVRHGWVSRGEAWDRRYERRAPRATADLAWHDMTNGAVLDETLLADGRAAASFAAEWFAEHEAGDDYEHNLSLPALSGAVRARTAGIAASMLRWHGRKLADAAVAAAPVMGHVGVVGGVLEADVTVLRVSPFEGRFGTNAFVSMADASGHRFAWFASTTPREVQPGDACRVRGKVKEHGTGRDGRAQTVLTRCRFFGRTAQTQEAT